jgi:hypothetical protein
LGCCRGGDPFLVLREEEEVIFEGKSWPNLLNSWLKLVPASGRFKAVDGQVVVLQDMTARDYVESDPLDLDHLSTSARGVTVFCPKFVYKFRTAYSSSPEPKYGYVSTCGAMNVMRP